MSHIALSFVLSLYLSARIERLIGFKVVGGVAQVVIDIQILHEYPAGTLILLPLIRQRVAHSQRLEQLVPQDIHRAVAKPVKAVAKIKRVIPVFVQIRANVVRFIQYLVGPQSCWTAAGMLNIYNFVLFLLFITSWTIVMTWVYNNTKGSLFMAILGHASGDAFPNMILWPLLPASLAVTGYGVYFGYYGMVIGMGVLALAVIAATRGRLGYQNYQQEEDEEVVGAGAATSTT
jgi:hypothetical protein